MNAGGVDKACKSSDLTLFKVLKDLSDEALTKSDSGKRVRNAWVTYLKEEHSFAKAEVILHNALSR